METAINEIIERSTVQVTEGDYQENGLWMCGKCHTPKQVRIKLFGMVKMPMCLCQCEKARIDAEEKELSHAESLKSIMRDREVGFPDKEMQTWTFENDDRGNPKVTEIAKKYVENFKELHRKGKGLLLYGEVGTGKTYIAASIANALIDRGYPCLVTNFARLVNTISGMFEGKQTYLDSLNRFDLLVIDDLASERNTDYMNEIIFNIIDSRYRSGKPLIVTTNLTPQNLVAPEDIRKERIYSRVLEMCVPVSVSGKDRRKARSKEQYKDIAKLLGIGG